jgi:hypothetical protein
VGILLNLSLYLFYAQHNTNQLLLTAILYIGPNNNNNKPLGSVHILSKKSGKVCREVFNILLVAFSGLVLVV